MNKRPRMTALTTCASLLLLALLTLAATAAAEPVSRAIVIRQALKRNPQIAAARARRAQAEAEQVQADSARWPLVSVEVGVGPSLRASLVPGTAVESTRSRYDFAARDLSIVVGGRVNIVQPLYTFGKIDAFRAAAAHGIRARDAQAHITRADVALDVARLYEGLLFARDATRFFEELENYVNRAILSTNERLEANTPDVTEQDVLRLQAGLAAVRLALNNARAGQEQARAGIVAYLGLAGRPALEIAEDELKALQGTQAPTPWLIANALRHRPELDALKQGALAYDSLAVAEHAGLLPDLFLIGFIDGAYTPGRDLVESRYVIDPLYHLDPGVLLGMRWQIQGAMAQGRSEQRSAQARELRDLQSWAMSGLPAQVKKAYADVSRARLDMLEAHNAVGKAKRWMVQANNDYLVGLANSQALADAVRAYTELRTAELDATYRHNVAVAELAYATGTIVDDRLGLYPGKDTP
jgi:outer membrane protein TolC